MKRDDFLLDVKHIHFIGIGGVNMSALALYLLDKGYIVSGSDLNLQALGRLKEKGVITYKGHNAKNILGADCVVYTSAIALDNQELVKAKEQNLLLIKRSELLSKILSAHKLSVAVSGSHGKTTSTDMLANVLISAKLSPTIFLGGEDKAFGNLVCGDNYIALTEACEYQKNFLDLNPDITVVLNIDNDHMDTYANMQEMVFAFKEFVGDKVAVINADDEYAKRIFNRSTITFGITERATFMAKKITERQDGVCFSVYAYGKKTGRINLKIKGRHNVYNALATIAVCEHLKIPFAVQKQALENFCGVKRRNEYLGKYNNCLFYADYAHHPKEIGAMLKTYDKDKKYLTIFQPHTYSRTKLLMQDFIEVFTFISPLIIYKTFPAREKYDKSGCAKTLYNNINKENKKVYYAHTKSELNSLITKFSSEIDNVVFFGAGDIYDVAVSIINQKSNIVQ